MRPKIGIIGMGWVGASVAISTLHAGIAGELLLNDVDHSVAEGEAMDLSHGAPFYPAATVRSAAVEEMVECDAVVVTAGRGGKPGQSRLDLLNANAQIARELGRSLRGYRGVIVMVTNPVDVMTRVIRDSAELPSERVIGTGTMLDSARLRHVLGRELHIDPRSVHAHVVGEHGDSEVCLWSSARIGGVPLQSMKNWSHDVESRIATEVRTAAYEIIKRKGATNHAIGLVTASLLETVVRGERRVLTVSKVHENVLGVRDVALSLPAVVGDGGVSEVLMPVLNEDERSALVKSAEVLKGAMLSIS